MISTPDRQAAVTLIEEAVESGARRQKACHELGLTARTVQRWTTGGAVRSDGRPKASRPVPANRLSQAERATVLTVANAPRFASLPSTQIVPKLADEGTYLASESSFYRILRQAVRIPAIPATHSGLIAARHSGHSCHRNRSAATRC